MGFLSFMGHRIIGLILGLLSITSFLYAGFSSPMSLLTPTPMRVYIFLILGILLAIASIYFFKTQH
jgi:hypothetical protein